MEYQYSASGGTAPYSYSISSGALPTGLSMNSSGLVTGERNTPGTYSWTVRVVDSLGLECTIEDSAYVIGLTGDPPDGVVGLVYSSSINAIAGVGPFVYTIIGGALPDGLSLNSVTGAITGVPTTVEVAAFDVSVEDSNGIIAYGSFDIEITAADPDIGGLVNPGFGDLYNISRASEHDVAAGLELVIFNNGTWVVRRTTAGSVGGTPLTGTWHSAPAPGVGDDYEVKFVGTHTTIGDVDGTVVDPVDTGFMDLTSDISEACAAFASSGSGANHNQQDYKDYTVTFRKVGEVATVVDTITLQAEAST